jgi:predicted RNA polymerase sigma factor
MPKSTGAQAGLALLDQIDAHSGPTNPADLLLQLNCAHEATEAFDRAIGLTDDDAIRTFLLERSCR